MVRNQARKKPKDPGLVLLDEHAVPAAGGLGSRGGAVPNYMKATSCSGAKAGAGAPAAPPQPARSKAVLAPAAPRVGRATCSSAMRGPGAGACPYSYCSFKGHAHAPVDPLGSFVASRRRLIKTQQSMKLKGASPFRKPSTGRPAAGDGGYFLEIRAAPAGSSSDAGSGDFDFSAEEMEAVARRTEYVLVEFDRLGCGEDCGDGRAKGLGASADGSCGSSDVVSDGPVEPLSLGRTSLSKNLCPKGDERTLVDHDDDDFGACKSDISEELDSKREGNIPEDSAGDAQKESSVDSISSALSGISFEDVSSDCADAASSQSQRNKLSVARRRRRSSEEGGEQMRPFKPKPPKFLPAETGPEAEKVDLRHQAADDRRTAEEWMVDYALRKAVKKLARAQKRKVEMLVQAFETVLPTGADDKKPSQHDACGLARTNHDLDS
ncbi:hypothetical protein U9M48_016488 [Paspalum notatum var. saurae]|uniref:Calmodulin-binding domain-containing protein n=1 Tax=Paspalum notatum var. saurae TaxID=547442 RepID=A0AAQ3T9B7_PASNO